jgi:hypothetical protein
MIYFSSEDLRLCFVQDNRSIVEKINLRAIKSVFVGYSTTHKGYIC